MLTAARVALAILYNIMLGKDCMLGIYLPFNYFCVLLELIIVKSIYGNCRFSNA